MRWPYVHPPVLSATIGYTVSLAHAGASATETRQICDHVIVQVSQILHKPIHGIT